MTYSMKTKNKLKGASNFRAWKTTIDLILAKNKVLDIVKGKIVEPQFEARKENEPQNVAAMEKFKDNDNDKDNEVQGLCQSVIPILWITKEIMSRGPQVADMECRETT
jgi:hypothetical protein